ncbi:glycosyl hydrolase [Pedobacter heparinus]|uniref:glycosyl hydrolase n=1 Tax=Pedobacter heparinus TaxID=984 RepID=UPI00292DFC0E|nr:glycosyl hydrolase [Pedobacter heparinus]
MDLNIGKIIAFVLLVCSLQPGTAMAQVNESAKPWVLWHWIKGGVSKPGITADLEAMKSAGIGGAYLLSIKDVPNPPLFNPSVRQLTPEWWGMVTFAMQEARRLNLKLGMHVSDGFALAGGPWITPELSMQKVVSTQLNIKDKTNEKIKLQQPETLEGYYRDIAVYAYPSAEGAGISTQTVIPEITTSTAADASGLIMPGNTKNFGSNEPCWIQYAFKQPFTTRTIRIGTGSNNYQAQRLEIQVSDDGKNFRSIGRLQPPRHGWQDTDADVTHSIVPVTAKYYRFVYDKKGSEPGSEDLDAAKWKPSLKLRTLELFAEARINQYEGKAGLVWRVSERSTKEALQDRLCVPMDKIINLSDKIKADGSLDWKAPKGNWTILRIGHTSTGHKNATAGAGMGLECDKFNPAAVKLQFDSWYGAALERGGTEIASKVLNELFVDSWECGSQNWSPLFAAEFKKRRGYDLMPYLPAMVGIPLGSAELSEGFLHDVRKTIAELVADQFYQTLSRLTKEKGVTFAAENVAPTMLSDGLLHYKNVDVPMGEFWLNSPTHDKLNDMLDAISGAHIYGKPLIQAEAFTTIRMDWNEHPGNMKTLQDRNYALGVNKLVYHVFAHNPWLDQKPGMTLDGIGLYFQRDQTWWKPGRAWVDYATRCQELLQQGKPVADVAVFIGEELPRRSVLPDRLVSLLPGIFGADVVADEAKRLANVAEPLRQKPAGVTHSANMADPENWVNPLRGYAYDSFNPDVLLGASVKEGRVVFASGVSYAILVIPGKMLLNPNYQYMSKEVVAKLNELAKAGATLLLGDRPKFQLGLPKTGSDRDFETLLAALWDGNFKTEGQGQQQISVKTLGKGRIIMGAYQAESFDPVGLERDLLVKEENGQYAKKVAYTHRIAADKEFYFIANQENKERLLEFSFRTSGKTPELYDAVTDKTIGLQAWKAEAGRTTMQLKLKANASVFVIFKDGTVATASATGKNWKDQQLVNTISGSWKVSFDPAYGGPEKPVTFTALNDWTRHPDSLIRYYSGSAVYSNDFKVKKEAGQQYLLDLGTVGCIAAVEVNGISCGIVWTAPFQADITQALRSGNNVLNITVTNTWANRIIGDQRLPEKQRITKTNAPYRLEGKPLNEAGLLGPVRLFKQLNNN